jgi:hypothetical protein
MPMAQSQLQVSTAAAALGLHELAHCQYPFSPGCSTIDTTAVPEYTSALYELLLSAFFVSLVTVGTLQAVYRTLFLYTKAEKPHQSSESASVLLSPPVIISSQLFTGLSVLLVLFTTAGQIEQRRKGNDTMAAVAKALFAGEISGAISESAVNIGEAGVNDDISSMAYIPSLFLYTIIGTSLLH